MASAEHVRKEGNVRHREKGHNYLGIAIPPRPESEQPIVKPDLERMPPISKYPWTQLRLALEKQVGAAANLYGVSLQVTSPETPVKIEGQLVKPDFVVAVHPLAKKLEQPPVAIARSLATRLGREKEKLPLVKNVTALDRGFVNIDVDPQVLGNEILSQVEEMGNHYGEVNIGNGDTVVLDVSSPNIAKHMSIAHLRSTVIGDSLAKLYQKTGHTAIRDNHLGDWGTQFGMLGRAYDLWRDEVPELVDGTNPVRGLYKLYTRMNAAMEAEKAEQKARGIEEPESTLEKEGKAWFKKLEEGDSDALALREWATGLSLQEFQRVYDLLGKQFEYQLGESEYFSMISSANATLEQSGTAERDQTGALMVRFPKELFGVDKSGEGRRVIIQKSDGTSLYAVRDLATIAARDAWFKPKKIIYVVGGEQQYYFQTVFNVYDKLAKSQKAKAPELEHVHFGMMSLPEGKMSTRAGRVIFLEDVLNESISRARAKVEETNRDLTEEEKDDIARKVGVGAVVYIDLSQGRERNIKFDWEQALSLEGNSGPSIQYSHARAKSILRKAEEAGIAVDREQSAQFTLDVEKDLVKHMGTFTEAIVKAQEANQPSIVAAHVERTAELFNRFYKEAPILRNDVAGETRNTRLRLTAASAQVIKNGLELLGIEAPEKM